MGQIQKIWVKEGQQVTKGQILININNNELEAKLAAAKAGRAEANAKLVNSEKHYQRINRLFEKGSATQSELDNAVTAYESAKSRMQALTGSVNELKELLSYTQLKSPIDGVVTAKMANEGDMATPGNPMLAIESVSDIKIVAQVPEFELELFEIGDPVLVFIKANREEPFKGWVDQVVPSSQFSGSQYKVNIKMLFTKGIKPGMFARISLMKGSDEKILVPLQSIYSRGQLSGVYTVNQQGESMLRWVRLGKTYPEGVEILSGLDRGESLIISADQKLEDGAMVEIKTQKL